MAGMPIRRERKRRYLDEMRLTLKDGLRPEHVLSSLGPGSKDATWTLLLDAILRLEHGLVRRGNELWGDCDACKGSLFSLGKIKARCADCGLDMDSETYIRLQLERKNGIHKSFR